LSGASFETINVVADADSSEGASTRCVPFSHPGWKPAVRVPTPGGRDGSGTGKSPGPSGLKEAVQRHCSSDDSASNSTPLPAESDHNHDQTGFWKNKRVDEITALIEQEQAGIPGLNRPFTQEESDELYQQLRAEAQVNLLYDDSDDDDDQAGFVANIVKPKSVRIGVALDSGATDNVIDPDDLPEGVELTGPIGEPFKDASGGDIKKFGKCVTLLQNEDTKVGCGWTACAVTRPLQSVTKIAGPEIGPGVQDVMFNNRIGVVMPPGLLNMLLKHIKPVAKYPRRGNLYVGDFEVSSFPRPGPAR
jgi:hypothetical protein